MPDVLADPRFLNLLFSAVVLVIGLCIYWLFSPQMFKNLAFTESAFEFWLLKWVVYLMTWGLLGKASDPRWTLATVDVNNVLTIGFFLVFWWGKDFSSKKLAVHLIMIFGLLFSWNFVSYGWASGAGNPGWWTTWGIRPSMVAATGSIALMAGIYLWRYRHAGLVFAIVSLGYVVLQLPAYNIIFPPPNSAKGNFDAQWLIWLAFAKLVYAVSFYGSYFSTMTNSLPVHIRLLPTAEDNKPRMRRALTFVSLALGSGILTAVGELIGKLLLKTFGS